MKKKASTQKHIPQYQSQQPGIESKRNTHEV